MKRRTFLKKAVVTVPAFATLGASDFGFAQDLQPITLPKPEKDGGKSVLASLQERKTIRNISPDPLPLQTVSNLLWAAFGVNRPEGGLRGKSGRTAASASNSQEIDLYVALTQGVFLYEAVPHRLTPVVAGDFRSRSNRRGAATSPVNIFYIVDLARYVLEGQPDRSLGNPEIQKSYYYVATGLIASNVYLFAASQGLAAWFHNCDKENTAKEFKLRPERRVLFAQTVGYSAKT